VQDGSIFSKQVTKNGRRLEAGKENDDTLGSEILDANWRVFVEVISPVLQTFTVAPGSKL
jgi:hypothetical protein